MAIALLYMINLDHMVQQTLLPTLRLPNPMRRVCLGILGKSVRMKPRFNEHRYLKTNRIGDANCHNTWQLSLSVR